MGKSYSSISCVAGFDLGFLVYVKNKNPSMHMLNIAIRDTANDTVESTMMIVTSVLVITCMGTISSPPSTESVVVVSMFSVVVG